MRRIEEEFAFDAQDEKRNWIIENAKKELLKDNPDLETAVFVSIYGNTRVRVITKIVGLGPVNGGLYKHKLMYSFCENDLLEEIPFGEAEFLNLPKPLSEDNYLSFMKYHYNFKDYFYINHLKKYAKQKNE